ncbi:GNAT family N-acetyltransferase [Streptomyces sp. NPDC088725]|uniref:GNAT family N-acetyltransferase n=1 Tax=Streptomyces sp. NPDC088725 TaxID=3365873 RepID=UPI0037FD6B81
MGDGDTDRDHRGGGLRERRSASTSRDTWGGPRRPVNAPAPVTRQPDDPSCGALRKELYAREFVRRRGVARAFMGELETVAAGAGCSRIEWTADTDNPPALAFYEALGAAPRGGKVLYRLGP